VTALPWNHQDKARQTGMPPKRQENSSRQIILVFALIMAVFYTWTSMSTPYQMGHDQTYLGTFLAKDRDPTLYLRDYAFHDDTLYRSYIPIIRWLFDKLSRFTGSFDQALLSLVPVVVFFFTLGTGLLLLEWSQSVWIALVITFLAIPYRAAPSGELWGVGGVEFVLARTLATGLAPFVFLLFFRFLGKPTAKGAVFTGVATGLLAFLHPPTALFLGELFTGLFILAHFWNRRAWLLLALMLSGYLLMAVFPLTFMEQQAPVSAAAMDFAGLRQVIHSYLKIPTNWGHFPGDPTEQRVWLFLGMGLILGLNYLLHSVNRFQAALQGWCWGNLVILYLCWRLAGKGAGFTWLYLVAAGYVIWRYRRQDLGKEDWWLLGMGFVVLAISLLPYYFLTLLWLKFDSMWLTSLVIEHYRAVRLIHPFFYLFSARAARYLIPQVAQWLQATPQAVLAEYTLLALTMFSRLLFGLSLAAMVIWEGWRLQPQWRRVMATGLICLFLVGASSLVFFPSVKKGVWAFMGRDLEIGKSRLDVRADEELYLWARTQTPKDSLFFYGSPLFRYRAQRSITHALGDLINHREARYVEIFQRYHRLEKAFENPATLLREARILQANYLLVEKSRHLFLPLTLIFENDKYLVYQLTPDAPGKGPSQHSKMPIASS
jgi:hypothetical protein